MKIHVKKVDGWTKELVVDEADELDRVREKVVAVLPGQDISPEQVLLEYEGNVLERGHLRDVGIREEGVVTVVIKDRQFIDITIEHNSEKFVLKVEPCETVANVKAKIADRKGFSVDEQNLFFGRREIVNGRLHHAGVSNGSVIQLCLSAIDIFVKNFEGNSRTFQVRTSDTVDHLMNLVHEWMNVDPKQQVLSCGGKQLQAGRKLKDYNICQNSTIHVTARCRGG